jgi:signal transduction histidine kinase/ActR/RegA family two-component response regulator
LSKSYNKVSTNEVIAGLDMPAAAAWIDAPRIDWSGMRSTEHFVQFYETDGSLLNSLGAFIGSAIQSGQGALVVATPAHRDALDELLEANGIDVINAKTSGRYVSLDAAETLARFMVNGSPDTEKFKRVIGSVITSVTDGRSQTRAFGEMVGLLWAEGNFAGALRVEELWTELQKVHSFSLYCAYPMSEFGSEQFMEAHGSICGAHSLVIPAESYSDLANPDARLRAIALLQQKAASLETEIRDRRLVEERMQLALVGEQMARAEAESANRMKDEFLATVSHELRTPLNAIIGWSHLLRSGKLDDQTTVRAMETIERNAKAQAQLIEDILDVSRVITGKLHLHTAPVDIASVINAAIDSVQLAVDAKDLHLEVTLDPSARHTFGDASRLQQVVWNLLSNAIKFTPVGGRIEIKVERAVRQMRLRICDTGCGIGFEFLPFIFDRFRQADGTTTRSHGGLGLGLAIVRHLVELHGGSITADSAGIDQGSTFTITLPLAPQSTSRRKKTSGSLRAAEISNGRFSSRPALNDLRVLLVDDDPDTLQVLRVVLDDAKAVVQTASSVSEALEIMDWFHPQILVSDLAMPNEDGYSLISKLRALEVTSGARIPAIALTSYVRVEDRARAIAAGFNLFVPKPVQPEELITAITSLAEDSSTV